MTWQAMDREDENRWLGMRKDSIAMTPELTFENTFPGKETQERTMASSFFNVSQSLV